MICWLYTHEGEFFDFFVCFLYNMDSNTHSRTKECLTQLLTLKQTIIQQEQICILKGYFTRMPARTILLIVFGPKQQEEEAVWLAWQLHVLHKCHRDICPLDHNPTNVQGHEQPKLSTNWKVQLEGGWVKITSSFLAWETRELAGTFIKSGHRMRSMKRKLRGRKKIKLTLVLAYSKQQKGHLEWL